MKTVFALISLLFTLSVFADEWTIQRDGDDIEMRQKYDSDYSNRYKGSRDDDGYTTLRNRSSGERLRGYIDDDGYGSLRDSDGNRIRVRPN
jgi:hypothetical protein